MKHISIALVTLLLSITMINANPGNPTGELMLNPAIPIPAAKYQSLRTWSIAIRTGLNIPLTDLRYEDGSIGTGDPVSERTLGFGGDITKMINHAIGIRVSFLYSPAVRGVTNPIDFSTVITPTDTTTSYRGTAITEESYYETALMSGGIHLYWNLSNTSFGINRLYKGLRTGVPKMRKIGWYIFGGFSFNQYQSQLYRVSNDTEITGNNFTHNEVQKVLGFPMGTGVKFKLNPALDLGVEASVTTLLDDNFDLIEVNEGGWIKQDQIGNITVALHFKPGGKNMDPEYYEWVNETELMAENFTRQETILSRIKKDIDDIRKDTDDDGVADLYDKEENTPAGYAVDVRGVTLDTDLDGVPDNEDMELFTIDGAEVDEMGVALDDDMDGVPNILDKEPNTAKTAQVDVRGVTIKSTHTETEVTAMNLPPIFFDVNSVVIKEIYYHHLFEMANLLTSNPGSTLTIIGNADQTGGNDYNKKLGERRAAKVAKYLVDNFKIPAERLKIETKGEEEPISRSNKGINRRVDFRLNLQ